MLQKKEKRKKKKRKLSIFKKEKENYQCAPMMTSWQSPPPRTRAACSCPCCSRLPPSHGHPTSKRSLPHHRRHFCKPFTCHRSQMLTNHCMVTHQCNQHEGCLNTLSFPTAWMLQQPHYLHEHQYYSARYVVSRRLSVQQIKTGHVRHV